MIDFKKIAEEMHIEEAALRAVVAVESNGEPFFANGKPAILFEAHVFYSELKKAGLNAKAYARSHPNICAPQWDRSLYIGGHMEYGRLYEAEQIHEEAAKKSASYGMFQVMGFNYEACDFDNVFDFVEAMADENEQVKAFIAFCTANNITRHLKNKDWVKFAKAYNGKGYAKNKYDIKLAEAYKRALQAQ